MSMRSFRQLLVVGFVVSFSSFAFARQPPSLVAQQRASANATRSSGGYRDLSWRFGSVPTPSSGVARMAGGYRDINYRFPASPLKAAQTASKSVQSRWR